MTTHIAKRSRTKVYPSSPVSRNIDRVKVTYWCGSEPKVPVNFLRDIKFSCWSRNALRPNRPVCPYMHGMNIPNDTFLDPCLHHPGIVTTAALVSHLCDHLIFLCGLGQGPGLIYVMRE